jgi:hypothetical protein
MKLNIGDIANLPVNFTPTATGLQMATLVFQTDENAALGQNGSTFTYSLQGNAFAPAAVATPEPAGILTWCLLSILSATGLIRGRKSRDPANGR